MASTSARLTARKPAPLRGGIGHVCRQDAYQRSGSECDSLETPELQGGALRAVRAQAEPAHAILEIVTPCPPYNPGDLSQDDSQIGHSMAANGTAIDLECANDADKAVVDLLFTGFG